MTLTLTDPQRAVLELLLGLHTPTEAAALLSKDAGRPITVGTVDRRLQRAQEANGGLSRRALKRQFLKERRRKR